MKDGDGYVLTSAIVAVTPDVGHIPIREPDPSKSVVHLLGGHKLMLNKSASEVIAAIEAESRPVEDPDFLEVQDTSEEAAQLLAWFDQRHDLMLVNQDGVWGVFQGGGSIVVASEDTAIEALRTAHRAFCDGR